MVSGLGAAKEHLTLDDQIHQAFLSARRPASRILNPSFQLTTGVDASLNRITLRLFTRLFTAWPAHVAI